jgi:AcrR family transcriptional regulator
MRLTVPWVSHETVLATAERLLAEDGAHGLSVRRLADALGVSRQIVYSRFEDKPGLVRALHAEGFRRLDLAVATVRGTPGTRDHVLALARAYRTAALAAPTLYELMFGRPVAEFAPDDAARAVAEASFAPVVAATRSWLVAHGKPASKRATRSLAQSLWSVTHGVVSLELTGHLGPDAPAILDRVVGALLDDT